MSDKSDSDPGGLAQSVSTGGITATSRALEGVCVVDLTRARSGPTAARQLADWGADVIKIETPGDPGVDDLMGGPRLGSDFQNLNRNKRSITLNLKNPQGHEILEKLVARADILIENFRPDVKHRLKIDYAHFRKINKGLIYASISGFGQEGPYSHRPGLDQVTQGMGGLMSVTGEPDGKPMRVGTAISDLSAGLFCAFGIVLALYERSRSGEGQEVQTSLLEAQIAMLDFQAARWLHDGEVAKRVGNDHPTVLPTGTFATTDGYINISVAGGPMWRKFCSAIGGTDLVDDERFASAKARLANRAALNEKISALLAVGTTDYWVEKLNETGIPCGPIYTMDEVFADPQVVQLGIAKPLIGAQRDGARVVGQPVSLSRTPATQYKAAPLRGDHTCAVLQSLGYSKEDIGGLRNQGVI